MTYILALWINAAVINFEFDTMNDCRTAAYIAIRLWPIKSKAICTDIDGNSYEVKEDKDG